MSTKGQLLKTHSGWRKLRPRVSLSYREFIECQYIGLFRISKSISYRTSHIEYLDIFKTNDFLSFFAENSKNSPKSLNIPRKFRKPMNQSRQQQQQRRKFQKIAENSENLPKIRRKFLKEGLL